MNSHDFMLQDSLPRRVARNFFTHSGHVPLVLLILEALLAKPGYFAGPDPYLLLTAGILQALVTERMLERDSPWAFLGNLSGPVFYSVAEYGLEGVSFFQQWHHQAYWAFAMGFTVLHALQRRQADIPALLVVAENVLRSSIPLVMYALFEARTKNAALSLEAFFSDRAHVFLSVVLMLIGVLLGFADTNLRRSLHTILVLAGRLRRYSEWSLGSGILDRAITDESTLTLQRVERAIVFMDIRGFTAWSEEQKPEAVVSMLNDYYRATEAAFADAAAPRPIKLKYTADEVMAVFADAPTAAALAPRMLAAASAVLMRSHLTAGAGVHFGPVVEGVVGGEGAKAYDFIGDTVNTAKRLCDAALSGEVLFSGELCRSAGIDPERGIPRRVAAKGKREPLVAVAMQVCAGGLPRQTDGPISPNA